MSDSDISGRVEKLSPERRALLERLLLERQKQAGRDTIPRRDRSLPTPLSFPQQRLWFLDQLAPGEPTYNAALAMRLHGPIDVAALEAGLRTVVERHEALRTVIRATAGPPEQVVLDDWSFALDVVDVRDLPSAERDSRALEMAREKSRLPFDLGADILLRAHLFRLDDADWILLLVEHHIAFDGWSDGVMFEEIAEVYRAREEGREPVLPELAIQYGDFAVWQRQQLDEGETLAAHSVYWAQQLVGAPPLLELPLDRARPARQTFAGVHHPLELPLALADKLRDRAREEAATPFMVVLAAFAGLLTRWSGHNDILVGTPIANRGRVELERMIGFFSNTLVLRVRTGGNPTFRELVGRVKETALGAYEHQDLPFEKIVEIVKPARDPRFNPLFQVNFRLQSAPPDTLQLPGVATAPFEIDVGFARFDLALEVQLHPDAFKGYVEYNEALFEASTAAWLAGAFHALLADALDRPDARLAELTFAEPAIVASKQAGSIRARRRA